VCDELYNTHNLIHTYGIKYKNINRNDGANFRTVATAGREAGK
jgi:hypothetical protein